MKNNTTPSFDNYDDAIDWAFIDAKHKNNFDWMIKRSGVSHWKKPFTVVINVDDFDDFSDAAEYMTGARLEIVEGLYAGEILVRCKGYFLTIGA